MLSPTPQNRLIVVLAALSVVLAGTTVAGFFAARHFYVLSKLVRLDPPRGPHINGRYVFVVDGSASKPEPPSRPPPLWVEIFGDSRVSQWEPEPQIPNHFFWLKGVPGETTTQVRARFERDALALRPSAIVIEAGVNDLVAASLVSDRASEIMDAAYENLLAMVQEARDKNVPVIVLTVVQPANPPVWRRIVWSDKIYELVAMLNLKIASMASMPGVRVLDAQAILGKGDRIARENAKDTLHFNAHAYDQLNVALTRLLASPNAVQ